MKPSETKGVVNIDYIQDSEDDPTMPWMEGRPYVKLYDCLYDDFPKLPVHTRAMIMTLIPYVSSDGLIKKNRGKAMSNKEINVIAKFSSGMVGKAMKELVDKGIFTRVENGKRYSYYANPKYIELVKSELSPWRKEHAKYTRSKEWKAKRQLVLNRDNNLCQQCGSDGDGRSLHVHHLTYKNFKNEPLEDLITLCDHCHSGSHGK